MNIKNNLIAVVLGVVFAAFAVVIAGFGAAISIPAPLVQTLQQLSVGFDVLVLDSALITLPMLLVFAGLAFSCRTLVKPSHWAFYAVLLAPLLVVEAYTALLSIDQAAAVATIVLRVSLLVVCVYWLVRQPKALVS